MKYPGMIIHIFNSSIVSGPETLVMPGLVRLKSPVKVVLLSETRLAEGAQNVKSYALSLGLQVIEIPVRSRLDSQAVSDLAKCLTREGATIVHSHDAKASYYALKASQKNGERRYKLVSTHHGIHARSGFVNILYEHYYVRRVLPHFDRVLSVCSSDREGLISRGLEATRVKVHLNGVERVAVDSEQKSSLRAEILRRWDISKRVKDRTLVFGVVARLSAEKRHAYILEVIKAFRIRHPEVDFLLLCFGSGPLLDRLRSQTRSLELEDRVLWMGYRENLSGELSGLDVLLSLSKGEGLPINVLEAGWSGTPVFATEVDGLRDVIGEGEGQLISVDETAASAAEQLYEFSKDVSTLNKVGKKFLARVCSQFSGTRWVSELEKIYNEL